MSTKHLPISSDVLRGLRFALDAVRAQIVRLDGRIPSNVEAASAWLETVEKSPERTPLEVALDDRAACLNLTAKIAELLHVERSSTSNLEDDLEDIHEAIATGEFSVHKGPLSPGTYEAKNVRTQIHQLETVWTFEVEGRTFTFRQRFKP